MKSGGRAGAVGLPQWEGRVSESGCCVGSSHPPLLLGESVYPPPPRSHHLIGYCCRENEPLLLARVPNERNHCAGWRGGQGGGRWYGPPQGPAPQCLAPRPCATWQEARAGGGGGLRTEASGWWPPRLRPAPPPPPLGGRDKPDLLQTPVGVGEGAGIGRAGLWVGGAWSPKSGERAAILRELQWRRRGEGRTLLSRGRGAAAIPLWEFSAASGLLRTALGLEEPP